MDLGRLVNVGAEHGLDGLVDQTLDFVVVKVLLKAKICNVGESGQLEARDSLPALGLI